VASSRRPSLWILTRTPDLFRWWDGQSHYTARRRRSGVKFGESL
jgi:lipocalin